MIGKYLVVGLILIDVAAWVWVAFNGIHSFLIW